MKNYTSINFCTFSEKQKFFSNGKKANCSVYTIYSNKPIQCNIHVQVDKFLLTRARTAILCNDLLFKIIGQFVQKCTLALVRDSSDL